MGWWMGQTNAELSPVRLVFMTHVKLKINAIEHEFMSTYKQTLFFFLLKPNLVVLCLNFTKLQPW